MRWSLNVDKDESCIEDVPMFVYQACQILSKCSPRPGLFDVLRESPGGSVDAELRECSGSFNELQQFAPESLLRGLVSYFRVISEPLLTDEKYPVLLEVSSSDFDEQRRVEAMISIFAELREKHPKRVATFAAFASFVDLFARDRANKVDFQEFCESPFLGHSILRRIRSASRSGGAEAPLVAAFFRSAIPNWKILCRPLPNDNKVPLKLLVERGSTDGLPSAVAAAFKSIEKRFEATGDRHIEELVHLKPGEAWSNLKSFLSDLIEPLGTFARFRRYYQLSTMQEEDVQLHLMRLLIACLPESHRLLFSRLLQVFGGCQSYSAEVVRFLAPALFAPPPYSLVDNWMEKSVFLTNLVLRNSEKMIEPFRQIELSSALTDKHIDEENEIVVPDLPVDEVRGLSARLSELLSSEGTVDDYDLNAFRELLVGSKQEVLFRVCRAVSSSDAQDRLSKALWILFDGANEGAFDWLVKKEVEKTRHAATLFRVNSVPTKIFTQHASAVGKKYLETIFASPLKYVDFDNLEQYEVDPTKVVGKLNLLINQDNLEWLTSVFISYICRSARILPLGLRLASWKIRETVTKKFHHFGSISVASFVVLRFICPTLIMPETLNLGVASSSRLRRVLVLVSKTVQTLANNLEFGSRASFMRYMNRSVRMNQCMMQDFLAAIPLNQGTVSVPPSEFSSSMKERALRQVFEEVKARKDALLALFVGEGEDLALAAEESDSTYDVVASISSLDEVMPPPEGQGGGWKVRIAPGMRKTFETNTLNWSSSVVAVLGLYNKGKTFVLNNLTNVKLASDLTAHTEGLSFKLIKNRQVNHIVLDTAGFFSPVIIDDASQAGLTLKKATDMFIEDLVFHLADFFIVVVTDLTSLDQEYILKLIMRLKSRPEKVQQLYVIHNLRDAVDDNSLSILWQEQVVDVYQTGELVREVVTAEDPVSGKLVEKEVEWFNAGITRHVLVANSGFPVGQERNPWVFALLKQWLAASFVPINRKFSPLDLVVEGGNMWLKRYVSDMGPLEYDKKTGVIRMVPTAETIICRLIPPHMDGHNVVFPKRGFVPNWDIVQVGTGETVETDGVDVSQDTDGNPELRVYCDLPGLSKKEVRVTKVGFDTIRITGKREQVFDKLQNRDSLKTQERKFGEFVKSFRLPLGYDLERTQYEVSDGVLRVTCPYCDEEEEL